LCGRQGKNILPRPPARNKQSPHAGAKRTGFAHNLGQFDWSAYYRNQRALASIDAEPQNVRVVAQAVAEGRELYRTHRCGAITVRITKGGLIDVATFRKR
jgi:hypothetical protein